MTVDADTKTVTDAARRWAGLLRWSVATSSGKTADDARAAAVEIDAAADRLARA